MEIRQLKYFVAIVEMGSFTKAARKLRIAQPALGVQIQKLEAQLGHQLLLRHSRGVEPTEAGLIFMNHVRVILEKLSEAEKSLTNFAGLPNGSVMLGMPPNMSGILSAELAQVTKENFPLIALSITEGFNHSIIDLIDEGRLDFGCVFESERSSSFMERSNLCITPLLSDRLVLASPVTFEPETGKSSISFSDIANLPLILPGPAQRLRLIVEDAASQQGLHLNVAVEAETDPLIRNLVSRGLGHSLLPYSSVHDDLSRGKLRVHSVDSPVFNVDLYLIYREDRPLSRAASAVIGCLREIVAEMGRREELLSPGGELPARA